jgi:hypothetical protein
MGAYLPQRAAKGSFGICKSATMAFRNFYSGKASATTGLSHPRGDSRGALARKKNRELLAADS